MADATFDGSNLHIQIPSTGTFDAQKELYSAWKEWIKLSDNAKYPPAFDTTGGDDVGGGQEIAPYFFCRNDLGWRIKMPQQDGEIVITGNLFARSPNTSLFEQTTGYDAFLRLEVSTRAVLVNGGGGSGGGGATAQEIWEYSGTRSLSDQLTAEDVWTYATRNITNGLTAADVWSYPTRDTTNALSAAQVWAYADALTAEDVWTYNGNRTLTSGTIGAEVWSYAPRTITGAVGVQTTIQL